MVATLVDRKERQWDLRLDAPTVKRIAEKTGIKLTDLTSDPFLRLATDPVLLIDVVWLVVEKQAKELGISDVEFGEECPDIDSVASSLVECVLDFFPQSRRSELQSLISETAETHSLAIAETIKQMQADRPKTAKSAARTAMRQMAKLLDNTESQ